MPGRVLIVDDHPMCREALTLAVQAAREELAVDQAASIAEALAVIRPDCVLVLLDLGVPDAQGFSGLLRLQSELPDMPVAVVSGSTARSVAAKAAHFGALGFVPKDLPMSRLVEAVRALLRGERIFSSADGEDLPLTWDDDDGGGRFREAVAQLTPAQQRILAALAQGGSNKQIAYDLQITEATVKAHLSAIYRRLGVNNRAQAVMEARTLLIA